MKRTSIAVLVVMAGLYGCATTESPQDTTAATEPTSSGTRSAGITPGQARPPVGTSRGSVAGQDPDLKRSVYFEFDKYDVKPEYRSLVETHARWLRTNPKARLTIEGNADERGSREYNVALGQKRAEAVTKMLMLMGAKADQIEAVSWGEEKPRSTGHDESSWSENRRSDFQQR